MFGRRSLLLALVITSACSDDGQTSSVPARSSSKQVSCATDSRVQTFASGLEARSKSGRLVAHIVTASPSPPQRGAGDGGLNVWMVKFQLDGAPVANSTTLTATTMMPDHGHGSPRVPALTANPDGTYTASNLFFFMAGVWDVAFVLGEEQATFSLCVE